MDGLMKSYPMSRLQPERLGKKFFSVIALLGLLLVPIAGYAKLPGKYDVIVPFIEPAPKSADVVVIHEVFAFDCGHCYHYYKSNTLDRIKKKYGDRVEVYYMPIGWRGPDPGRLYYIAEERGDGKKVMGMIFNFIFDKGLGAEMFTRDKLQFVARMAGLKSEFNTLMDSPEIISKMNASIEFSDLRRIDSTPTIVVQNVLKANREYDNLERLVEALLK